MSRGAGPERVEQGTLVLTVGADRLTLRDSWEGAAAPALAAVAGAVLAAAAAACWPAGWAVALGATGLALLAFAAWHLALGQVPYAICRRDRSVRRGPRRLGTLAGVYVRSGAGPSGELFTLYLRLEGRPARRVRSDDRRDTVQYVGMKLAAALGVPFHQGPGRPR